MPLVPTPLGVGAGEARAGLRVERKDGHMNDCTRCAAPTDELAVFPGGVCLTCWADSPEGRRMPTADELVAMWGGQCLG